MFERFEKANNISLFVFGYNEQRNIIPLYTLRANHSKSVRLFFKKGKGTMVVITLLLAICHGLLEVN